MHCSQTKSQPESVLIGPTTLGFSRLIVVHREIGRLGPTPSCSSNQYIFPCIFPSVKSHFFGFAGG